MQQYQSHSIIKSKKILSFQGEYFRKQRCRYLPKNNLIISTQGKNVKHTKRQGKERIVQGQGLLGVKRVLTVDYVNDPWILWR